MPEYTWVLEQVIRSLDFVWKVKEGFCEEMAFKVGPGSRRGATSTPDKRNLKRKDPGLMASPKT